ncbi:hypothetical protein ACFONN_07060 [Dyella humi]|uniref:Protein L n=1 Tax=Dyella humi TaxID=1770547 RepID=A0ABW8II33_9GAMM
MALYKNANYVEKNDDKAFDATHEPGVQAPYAGIYKCITCGSEIGIAQGHVLPPQGHHPHAAGLGPIKWQLAVYAQHKK